MKRKFGPFDAAIIKKEFQSLPNEDKHELAEAMDAYQRDAGTGYRVDSYGEGLYRLKGKSGQGRVLFSTVGTEDTASGKVRTLVVVLIYKKEAQKIPDAQLRLARKRLAGYLRDVDEE